MNSSLEKTGYLRIGKVVGVHGLKGNLKIRSYAESLSIFQPDQQLLVEIPEGRETLFTIKWVKPHTKKVLLSLKEIENRNLAEALVGSDIYIDRNILPEPEPGTYYWFDIIGLSVFTVDGDFLGRVDSILQTGSNDVYVVKDPDKGPHHEILIPVLVSVIRSVDLESKTIKVDLPEGL
ncbi:ribosome maturation factor RimM [Thermodesulfobacteriota bacterium]